MYPCLLTYDCSLRSESWLVCQAVSKEACDFAYDRPSHKLTPFLRKNYNLTHQDLQPNRYAIYPREGFPLFEN